MMGRGFGNGGPVGEGRRERRNLARKLDIIMVGSDEHFIDYLQFLSQNACLLQL